MRGRGPSHVLSRYAQQVQDLQGSRSRKPHMPCRAGKNCIVQLQETINSVHSTRCNGRPRLFAHFLYPPPSIVPGTVIPNCRCRDSDNSLQNEMRSSSDISLNYSHPNSSSPLKNDISFRTSQVWSFFKDMVYIIPET